jgi:hypothetical protein
VGLSIGLELEDGLGGGIVTGCVLGPGMTSVLGGVDDGGCTTDTGSFDKLGS